MIVRIDKLSEEPIYLQIRAQLIEAIANGSLRPGDGLPSVRSLASDLGVNLHTVNKAYAVMRDEGYLIMRGRAGAFVAEPLHEASVAQAARAAERLAEGLHQLVQEHKAAGGSAEAFLEEARTQVERSYADPGTAGAQRAVKVLGLDAEGNRLVERSDEKDSARAEKEGRGTQWNCS